MKIIIKKAPSEGAVDVPSSKSIGHRALIAAALSRGTSRIEGVNWSDDLKATCRVLSSFGASIQTGPSSALITGIAEAHPDTLSADAGESASTLRFLMPVGLALKKTVLWTGRGRLPERPLSAILSLWKEKGISYSSRHLPFWLSGNLQPGRYALSGKESSQYFSGLLMALPLLNGNSALIPEGGLESAPYAEMTRKELQKHGIVIEEKENHVFEIPGRQVYKAINETIEGDYSAASFWLAMGLLGTSMTVSRLAASSMQGDEAVLSMMESLKGRVERTEDGWKTYGSTLEGRTISLEQNPDLLPVLAALGAVSKGITRLIRAKRARLKESDRIHAMAVELSQLGADVKEEDDGLILHGKETLKGGLVSSHGDHRVAMALSIVQNRCRLPIEIAGAECVKKSDPSYWKRYRQAGGEIVLQTEDNE